MDIARQARFVYVDRNNAFFVIPSSVLPQDVVENQVTYGWSNMSPQARAEWGGNPITFAYGMERLTSLRRA
jgi:hypothetical protein